MGEWPECGARVNLWGQEMVCHLPKDHHFDGQDMHEDPEKGQWLVTVTLDDGTVKRA